MSMIKFNKKEENCCYIDGRIASSVMYFSSDPNSNEKRELEFTKLAEKYGAISLSALSQVFNCNTCNACKPIRVSVCNFTPSRSQKKVLRKNKNIKFKIEKIESLDVEKIKFRMAALHKVHDIKRFAHNSGNNFESQFLITSLIKHCTHLATIKSKGKIIGYTGLKISKDGVLAIEKAYDCNISKDRSLGVLLDLKAIEYAKNNAIPHFYLGAINLDSNSIAHQGRYSGSEAFNKASKEWIPIPRNPTTLDYIS